MVTLILIIIVVLLATMMQSLSGFGFALLMMPLMTFLLGISAAGPLVALAGLTLYTINVIRYRRQMLGGEIWRLAVAAIAGAPVGVWALTHIHEGVIKFLLGLVLIGYAGYELFHPTGLTLRSQRWSYLAGFVGGCLGGAYNTTGPPVVIYGSMRRWPKQEFRAVVQTIFFVTAVMTVASHYVANRLTPAVLSMYVTIAPAMLIGLVVGSIADRWVDRRRFRLIVALTILVLGVTLSVDAFRAV